jgi:hypothetical protein
MDTTLYTVEINLGFGRIERNRSSSDQMSVAVAANGGWLSRVEFSTAIPRSAVAAVDGTAAAAEWHKQVAVYRECRRRL